MLFVISERLSPCQYELTILFLLMLYNKTNFLMFFSAVVYHLKNSLPAKTSCQIYPLSHVMKQKHHILLCDLTFYNLSLPTTSTTMHHLSNKTMSISLTWNWIISTFQLLIFEDESTEIFKNILSNFWEKHGWQWRTYYQVLGKYQSGKLFFCMP